MTEFVPNTDAPEEAGFGLSPPEVDEATRQMQAQGPTPPNLSEGLAQMQATQQEILSRLDGEEEDPDPQFGVAEWDDEELAGLAESSGLLDQGAENHDAELDDVIDERVQQALTPIAGQLEWNRRYEVLSGLQDKYQLTPDEIERVSEDAAAFAASYGNASDTDPALVERLILADRALARGNAELSADPGPEGATLETGVGPSSPQGEPMDADTKSYMDAIAGTSTPNRFTR